MNIEITESLQDSSQLTLRHCTLNSKTPYFLPAQLYMLKSIQKMSKCIFCDIVQKKADAVIIKETEDIIVFKDIKPAAKFHFLAVPKQHIDNPKCLTMNDKELVEKLRDSLKASLEEQEGTTDDVLYGFHWPPFNSVKHLHMHGIAPASSMGWLQRWIFSPDSFWFKTADYVLNVYLPSTSKTTGEGSQ